MQLWLTRLDDNSIMAFDKQPSLLDGDYYSETGGRQLPSFWFPELRVGQLRKLVWDGYGQPYDPNYGDDRLCTCGHPYERHFDGMEDCAAVGCKYCDCVNFLEANGNASG